MTTGATPAQPAAAAVARDPLVVETSAGRVRGLASQGAPVRRWRGVPYAAPPVGALRFAAPRPHAGWSGVRDATEAGRAAPQPVALRPGPLAVWLSGRQGRSEDCLTVDVWAPSKPAPPGGWPVAVWLHGGSFTSGSGGLVDAGQVVAEGELVLVAVSYRLGGLGFVAIGDAVGGDERIASNPGLRDALAALRWVREEIAAFGGDPGRVTLAGESAGSAAASLLATSTASSGLLHGVIAQSGALTLAIDREDAARNARAVLDELGVSRERMERLWEVPASAIVAATARAQARRSGALVTRPWWDDDLLPAALADGYAAFADVPLLIGSNVDEHRTFTRLRRDVMPLTRDALATVLVESFGAARAEAILATYPRDADGLNDLGSDLVFAMPSIHLAEQRTGSAPTYLYRLDLASRLPGLGAFHGIELTQLFGVGARMDRLMFGRPTPERAAFARGLRARWAGFVRDGHPGAGWPPYEARDGGRAVLRWGLDPRALADPHRERRLAWAGGDATVH